MAYTTYMLPVLSYVAQFFIMPKPIELQTISNDYKMVTILLLTKYCAPETKPVKDIVPYEVCFRLRDTYETLEELEVQDQLARKSARRQGHTHPTAVQSALTSTGKSVGYV